MTGLLEVELKVQTAVVSQRLHPEVLGLGAAAVGEHAGVVLVLTAALQLDPVRHGGEELLGQGENPLVLPCLLSTPCNYHFLSAPLRTVSNLCPL